MKILFTKDAFESLDSILHFYSEKVSEKKLSQIIENIFNRIEILVDFPHAGQIEEVLKSLNKGHRRIIAGNYKIIYRIENNIIYITDIFDTRQNTSKMKK